MCTLRFLTHLQVIWARLGNFTIRDIDGLLRDRGTAVRQFAEVPTTTIDRQAVFDRLRGELESAVTRILPGTTGQTGARRLAVEIGLGQSLVELPAALRRGR